MGRKEEEEEVHAWKLRRFKVVFVFIVRNMVTNISVESVGVLVL
jgi:hypothetical protein